MCNLKSQRSTVAVVIGNEIAHLIVDAHAKATLHNAVVIGKRYPDKVCIYIRSKYRHICIH